MIAEREMGRAPVRSQLHRLLEPNAFLWATGIEDTFVFNPHPRTGRMLDEYALTRHYDYWRSDLDLMVELGISAARYGIPWYRVNPAPGEWDWSFADQALEHMLDLGIDPIVDLIHYGTPGWLSGSFLDPRFPEAMTEYATRVAERFRRRIRWYTPMNEPRIAAHYCGRIGWWPPNKRGWKGLVQVLLACCKGIIMAERALTEVDPEIVKLHVDAMDHYMTLDPSLEDVREFKQTLVFLPTDLLSGRIDSSHPLFEWLLAHGATHADLEWFLENALVPDVIGINLYPMFSKREVVRTKYGLRYRVRYGDREMVKDLGRWYWERYRRPLMISETASMGSVKKRMAWMKESFQAVKELREEGVPMVGYTWWPMFDLVSWGYRQVSERPIEKYIVKMGLWELEGPELNRVRLPLVDEYAAAVAGGAEQVGLLHKSDELRGVA